MILQDAKTCRPYFFVGGFFVIFHNVFKIYNKYEVEKNASVSKVVVS